jgi:hypothetical protein
MKFIKVVLSAVRQKGFLIGRVAEFIIKWMFASHQPKPQRGEERADTVDYYKEIYGFLDGTKLNIPRERLDWRGYSEVLKLYERATIDERREITKAMARIISESTDWEVVADTIHLAYHLDVREEVKNAIERLDITKVDTEWQDIVKRQRKIYIEYITST